MSRIADIEEQMSRIGDWESKNSTLMLIGDRLRRLERWLKNRSEIRTEEISTESIVKEDKSINLDIDYFMFENKFRGSREDIKDRQKKYLRYYIDKSNVVDLGCGRGEFLELLTDNNINVKGIDINNDFVEFCIDKGLEVEKHDIFIYLQSLDDNSIDGIFCGQVIEHFYPEQIIKFINLAYQKLKVNGVIIVETINPQNLVAVSNWFYMDPTHKKPVHPMTLQFLMQSEGYRNIELLYLHPNDKERIPCLDIQNENNSNIQEFNTGIERLNNILYGAQDYAIVARK